jgi:hypothetical protein
VRTGVKSILGNTSFSEPHDAKRDAFQTMCRPAAAGELSVPVEELPLDDIEEGWRRRAYGPHTELVVRT